jgi:hypothetical protein
LKIIAESRGDFYGKDKSMKNFFYVAVGMQLVGMASVGLCLFSGLKSGDYGQLELAQLLFGSFLFYVGTYFKGKN